MRKILNLLAVIMVMFCNVANAENKKIPDIKLNNGVKIPQLGLGTYKLSEGNEAYNSVLTALQNGYRHIDTAHAYQNERSVGKAVKDSGIPREEIWITSKLWPNEYGEGKTLEAIDKMLNRLGIEYIDLVYLHQPVGDYDGAWKDLIKAQQMGKVKALGISNFDKDENIFNTFMETIEAKPQVMQLECHPYAQRSHWQKVLKKHNIAQENWFPLGGRESNGAVLADEELVKIAQKHNKSVAQIIIRWHIQNGFIVIPGASDPEYIKENIEVFDFALDDADMAKISALNKEKRFYDIPFEKQKEMYRRIILAD